ncbi:basement membrane-specific heparan sulfate proteoglycan core protein-like isoform X6 [Labeo rohita]|uniref:basement membrane-specific heparan sulfate proteoglycan core protein-like isoform X6 n=1 Tax=Labeo rohita TaxID=84645 RepID=UPI0021E28707|nr:basement membrane-specific heparan sulfate proteoglycan core protein-like isoform X6 [Labeo rohita]
MGSSALPLILLLMSLIHAGLTQERSKPVVKVTPDQRVFIGETVTLTCDIQGGGNIQWIYWFKAGYNYNPYRTTTTAEFSFRADYVYYSGKYSCRGERSDSQRSDISAAVTLTVSDLPTSTLTVTPDSPVFTGETVKLTCVIESYSNWRQRNGLTYDPRYDWTPDWRYEWYKGTDRVMLQTSDRYTVNRDTLTIRGATEFDQGHYWCRGQRDKRPSSSQSSSAVSFTVMGLPTSNMTVTPQTVFTEETVNLTCVIESYSNWRYEWYKGTNNSVMLQTSDHYTVNRDTLTIRGATESDQDQYWCRGQRDERPSSSQESKQMYLSVHVSASSSSSSSLPVIAVVVLLSVFLLIFISLLLLWRYKKNKDQQRNVNQTSDPNQSAEFQMENFPLQSADCDHIYDAVTEVNKRHKDDPETFSEITYSEVTVQKKIPVDKDDTTAESNEVTYSEVRTKVKKCKRKGADAGVCDAVYAQPTRKKGP